MPTTPNEAREKIIMLAKLSSENHLLQKLKQQLEEYCMIRNQNNKEHLTFSLLVLLTRYATEKQTVTEALNEVNDLGKMNDTDMDRKDKQAGVQLREYVNGVANWCKRYTTRKQQ